MGSAAAGLAEADRDWFEPLLEAFTLKRLDEAELWIAGHSVLLTRRDRWRFWRRVRPWHEALA
jgi:hypothetical protein